MTYTYNDQAIFEAVAGSKAIIRRPIGMFDFRWKTYAAGVVDALNNKGSTSSLELGRAIHEAMLDGVNESLAKESPSMKLVDILAREMEFWPEMLGEKVGQCHDGKLHGYSGGGHPSCTTTAAKYSKCRSYGTEVVTRAEWQAAVDALNAPKVVEWDGVGDPPVGTVCEYDARPSGKGEPLFVTVEVKYVSDQSIVIICTDVPDCEKKENIGVELALMNGLAMRGKLRPIRTAEQVAAEKRDKAVNEMVDTLKRFNSIHEACGMLYDAGYLKP